MENVIQILLSAQEAILRNNLEMDSDEDIMAFESAIGASDEMSRYAFESSIYSDFDSMDAANEESLALEDKSAGKESWLKKTAGKVGTAIINFFKMIGNFFKSIGERIAKWVQSFFNKKNAQAGGSSNGENSESNAKALSSGSDTKALPGGGDGPKSIAGPTSGPKSLSGTVGTTALPDKLAGSISDLKSKGQKYIEAVLRDIGESYKAANGIKSKLDKIKDVYRNNKPIPESDVKEINDIADDIESNKVHQDVEKAKTEFSDAIKPFTERRIDYRAYLGLGDLSKSSVAQKNAMTIVKTCYTHYDFCKAFVAAYEQNEKKWKEFFDKHTFRNNSSGKVMTDANSEQWDKAINTNSMFLSGENGKKDEMYIINHKNLNDTLIYKSAKAYLKAARVCNKTFLEYQTACAALMH